MPRRLPQWKVDEIRDAYNAWASTMYQAGSETIDQLAARVGVSKPTIYDLKRQGWDTNGPRRAGGQRAAVAALEVSSSEHQQKIAQLQLENSELKRRVEDLEQAVHALGRPATNEH